MKEYTLEGVKTYPINILPDERGFFSEALRADWKEFLGDEQIQQINLSYSYPNIIRAWHKHTRGQIDHFLVLQGCMKICAYDQKTGKMILELLKRLNREDNRTVVIVTHDMRIANSVQQCIKMVDGKIQSC